MSRSGREALPNVQKWSESPAECPEVVGWFSRMSGSGLEVILAIWEFSEGPPRYP